ncbi:MAG: sugar-binding domain-containing protein, partial [Planctomycetota bacterium]
MKWMVLVILVSVMLGCSTAPQQSMVDVESREETLDLAGDWTVVLDPEDIGQSQKWYQQQLDSDQTIHLPGSLTGAGLGDEVTAQTQWTLSMWNTSWQEEEKYKKHLQDNDIKVPFCLQPVKHYVGKAWYSRAFTIPPELQGKHMSLLLERCHWEAAVWIDGKPIGTENSLCTPNRFQIGSLNTGTHRITVCIDNTVKINVGVDAHSVTDHTQTNWNGVIGAIELQARDSIVIDDVQVYPDIGKKQAIVRGTIINRSSTAIEAMITLDAKTIHGQDHDPDGIEESIDLSPGENYFEMTYDMGNECILWDEFAPNVYEMKAKVRADDSNDVKTVSFGIRQFKAEGTQFVINGRKIFLRGTLECCIFPLTGYPPTDINEWARIIKVAQS